MAKSDHTIKSPSSLFRPGFITVSVKYYTSHYLDTSEQEFYK